MKACKKLQAVCKAYWKLTTVLFTLAIFTVSVFSVSMENQIIYALWGINTLHNIRERVLRKLVNGYKETVVIVAVVQVIVAMEIFLQSKIYYKARRIWVLVLPGQVYIEGTLHSGDKHLHVFSYLCFSADNRRWQCEGFEHANHTIPLTNSWWQQQVKKRGSELVNDRKENRQPMKPWAVSKVTVLFTYPLYKQTLRAVNRVFDTNSSLT